MIQIKKLQSEPSQDEIIQIHRQISGMINRTPVMTSHFFNQLTNAEIYFKCENFQKIGAFKMRGASSAILSLTEAERARGVTTHSSGNHAQAVARAAHLLGIKAYIVMPENAPQVKVDSTQSFGAEITFCESTLEARESILQKVVDRTGAVFIHPYNNYNVIAGQATAAKELLESVPDLDAIIAPVGGGGLASGTALWCHYQQKKILSYGAEPAIVDDALRSLQAGHIVKNDRIDTIADGLRTNLGEYTFKILYNYLEEIFTVTEKEIKETLLQVWQKMKIVIEPSCVVPLAALIKQKKQFAGKKVGIILSGGNVDFEPLTKKLFA